MEKGYYHCVYVFLGFKNEYGVYRKEYYTEIDIEPEKYDMEDVAVDDEKEHH